MTTQLNESTDVEPEDELVVLKLLSEMVQNERWELTDLGRAHFSEGGTERSQPTETMERLADRDERHAANGLRNR